VHAPPVQFDGSDWAFFIAANVIIWYFCAGKLRKDLQRWAKSGFRLARFRAGGER
jgi:hypothetical protein